MAKSVVLAVLDSLRYDLFRRYVHSRPGGVLHRLYTDGTWYSGATAPAPWTLPSHASMFTGQYPREHGATRIGRAIDASLPLLSTTLQDEGFSTGCFTANVFIQPEFGFHGWDTHRLYDRRFQAATLPNPDGVRGERLVNGIRECLASERPVRTFANGVSQVLKNKFGLLDSGGGRLSKDASNWVRERDGDWFLFMNFMETHFPHRYLSPRRRRLQNFRNASYFRDLNHQFNAANYYTENADIQATDRHEIRELIMSEVAYVERQLGRLVATLKETQQFDDTLFIVCSDHGDAFGEDGFAGHVAGIGEPIVRVPLVIHGPRAETRTVTDRVSLAHLRDTITSFAGLDRQADLRFPDTCPDTIGTENTNRLLDIVNKEAVRHPRYLATREGVYHRDTPHTKWVRVNQQTSRYATNADSVVEEYEADVNDDIVEVFFGGLQTRSTMEVEMQEATEQRLRDLGYL